jgi:hypothetical protein
MLSPTSFHVTLPISSMGRGASVFRLLAAALIPALAGCQAASQPLVRGQNSPSQIELSAPAQPPAAQCAAGRTARLTNGVIVSYLGPDPKDHDTCLSSWNGKTHRFVLGVLPKGRGHRTHSDERHAIRAALLGPAGTRAEFEDQDAALWGRVTVEHVADPALQLEGGSRRTAQLRVVRHDAYGRARVRQVMLHWIDIRTGIVLKSQVVTEMDDGKRLATDVWQVERLG